MSCLYCRRDDCPCGGRLEMENQLRSRAEAAEREAERLRHGVPIEGDFVCPDSLRADAAEKAAREQAAVAKEWMEATQRALQERDEARDSNPGWSGAHEVLKQDYANMEFALREMFRHHSCPPGDYCPYCQPARDILEGKQ